MSVLPIQCPNSRAWRAVQSGKPGLRALGLYGIPVMDQGGYLRQLLRYPVWVDAVTWLNGE